MPTMPLRPDDVERSCFVSYDITDRAITVQFAGDDEHRITSEEAMALRAELLAAVVAENEHRVLLDDETPAG